MSHQRLDCAGLMRERGFRVTLQRQLILDAICQGGGHTTPDEVYERVRATAPTINRATVYRNLDFLCEMRLIVAARIGRRTLYEIAGEAPHHHLVCRTCNTIEPLGHDIVRACFARIEREQRFAVDMDHVTLFGLCENCQSAVGGAG